MAEQQRASEAQRQERLDTPEWSDVLLDTTGKKAVFFTLALVVLLWFFALVTHISRPASSTSNANPVQSAAVSPHANDGPSFDCQKTDGAVLKLICSTPQLAAADREMAAAYRTAQTPRVDPVLSKLQQNWIMTRNNSAADVSILAQLYKDRINTLQHYRRASMLHRLKKPAIVDPNASPPSVIEQEMRSKTLHDCTHDELVQVRIAKMNGYTGGPNCANAPQN